jgi:exopolysaccharide biosynthesis WecB/TagA/CpsF family protein
MACAEHAGMAPIASISLLPAEHVPEPAPAGIHFGAFPITETGPFPPAPAPHCWVYVTVNAEIALSLPDSPPLQALTRSPRARVSVDGQWLWWALRRKYPGHAPAKLSGSDLLHVLARHCAQHGQRLLLLGSTPALNGGAVQRLRQSHPTLAVAGYAPPRHPADTDGLAALLHDSQAAIDAFQADYVVLGLGAAKEHALALQLSPRLDARVRGLLCFGGAIDMASGRVRRAPRLFQQLGLEGLYRVWQQPARLPRFLRILRVLPLLARGDY